MGNLDDNNLFWCKIKYPFLLGTKLLGFIIQENSGEKTMNVVQGIMLLIAVIHKASTMYFTFRCTCRLVVQLKTSMARRNPR